MKCPACGAENADGTQRCTSCCFLLDGPGTVTVRVSKVAVVSAILALIGGVCSIPLVVVLLDQRATSEYPTLMTVALYTSVYCGGLACFLGLLAMALIASYGGRLTGRGFATIGVVVPVIGALLGFWVAASARRSLGSRVICGNQLSGIGKAMLMYAFDNDGRLPATGGSGTLWGSGPADWTAADRFDAFGLDPNRAGGIASISSSLYLLVRYAEVSPKSFVCPAERRVSEFDPSDYPGGSREPPDVWDFGPNPAKHCSYAYHLPYGGYALTTSRDPHLAVLADRSPWIDSPTGKARDFSLFEPDLAPFGGTQEEGRHGNSQTHEDDGQQVVFLDAHVEFMKRPYETPSRMERPVPTETDNIYTSWDGQDRLRGGPPKPYDAQPAAPGDSLLLNDPPRP